MPDRTVNEPSGRITVGIALRLNIGRMAVYTVLERRIMPGIRLRRRWIITRHAYEQWGGTRGATKPQEEAKCE